MFNFYENDLTIVLKTELTAFETKCLNAILRKLVWFGVNFLTEVPTDPAVKEYIQIASDEICFVSHDLPEGRDTYTRGGLDSQVSLFTILLYQYHKVMVEQNGWKQLTDCDQDPESRQFYLINLHAGHSDNLVNLSSSEYDEALDQFVRGLDILISDNNHSSFDEFNSSWFDQTLNLLFTTAIEAQIAKKYLAIVDTVKNNQFAVIFPDISIPTTVKNSIRETLAKKNVKLMMIKTNNCWQVIAVQFFTLDLDPVTAFINLTVAEDCPTLNTHSFDANEVIMTIDNWYSAAIVVKVFAVAYELLPNMLSEYAT